MDLKNYLLEYVSSGRRRKKIGTPVEPYTWLSVGDEVMVKDEEWLDSLEKDSDGDGIINYKNAGSIIFTGTMKRYLGERVIISNVIPGKIPRYNVRLPDKNPSPVELFVFTNEMLEYL